MIEGSGDNSKWNKTALLHAILKSEPSTPEMGLIFHSTLNFKSEVSLQMAIAELEAIRNINERYSRVQFMPGPELMLLVKNGLHLRVCHPPDVPASASITCSIAFHSSYLTHQRRSLR